MNPRNAIVSILPALVFPLSLHAADSSWKQEWEKTVQAANKEGQVTAYVYRYEAAFNAFRAEYPGIKLNTVSGSGSQLCPRLTAERGGRRTHTRRFVACPKSSTSRSGSAGATATSTPKDNTFSPTSATRAAADSYP